ncbi:hypothetical protein [Sinomonas halotolerans]|uniref:Histone acetyltransferase Rv0428c-like SH3 domain-containing protein n=1 Tax=Sinomonas halotolerans TaxID=1644133 RepID=A0ABU9WW53_9MICC
MPDSPLPPPARRLLSLAPGTRVVVRYRIEGGFTDALGELADCTGREARVRTRGGVAVVRLEDVVAAKPVPPPPPRRAPRSQAAHDAGPVA